MKTFYVNVYQDARGQWYGDRFRSRARAKRAAERINSKCVGRLKVKMKNFIRVRLPKDFKIVDNIKFDMSEDKRMTLKEYSERFWK